MRESGGKGVEGVGVAESVRMVAKTMIKYS